MICYTMYVKKNNTIDKKYSLFLFIFHKVKDIYKL